MSHIIPPLHDCIAELGRRLAEQGSLGVVTMDLGPLLAIEDAYGVETFERVRERVLRVLLEQRGADYRETDVLALDRPRGLIALLFLDAKRQPAKAMTPLDMREAARRMGTNLAPNLARMAFPYTKGLARVEVGSALALNNPLVHGSRPIEGAVRDAVAYARHRLQTEKLERLDRLQELIVRERVVTAYQPIQLLKDRSVLGCEALSRGARGTGFETAGALFGAAESLGLQVELDRLCRRRAVLSSGRIPPTARLFVNTLPATIRDPQFRGRALIEFLEHAKISPERIVIEITEKLVIDNYSLFSEAMAYFTDLGMSFAVDDVGSGYSGLESIARLKPHFLKIDISLVRDVHSSAVNREMVKAILSLGRGISSTVIAEGIQTAEEAQALQDLGVDYGQGFYLARPEMPRE